MIRSAPNLHARAAELAIRTIKDRMRATLTNLTYQIRSHPGVLNKHKISTELLTSNQGGWCRRFRLPAYWPFYTQGMAQAIWLPLPHLAHRVSTLLTSRLEGVWSSQSPTDVRELCVALSLGLFYFCNSGGIIPERTTRLNFCRMM